jgi:hypothetical protein
MFAKERNGGTWALFLMVVKNYITYYSKTIYFHEIPLIT